MPFTLFVQSFKQLNVIPVTVKTFSIKRLTGLTCNSSDSWTFWYETFKVLQSQVKDSIANVKVGNCARY